MRYGDIIAIGHVDLRYLNQPGKIVIETPLAAASQLIAIGAGTAVALRAQGVVADNTIAIGDGALALALAASANNIAIGTGAGAAITTATGHTLIGTDAGAALTDLSTFDNVFIGRGAGSGADFESEGVYIGIDAGALAGQSYNADVLIGARAGSNALTHSAVCIGYNAGLSGAQFSIIIGESACAYHDARIIGGVVIGYLAAAGSGLPGADTPDGAVIIGFRTAINVEHSNQLTAVGAEAFENLVSGGEGNTGFGYRAGQNATSRSNTLVGNYVGSSITTSPWNTIIGARELLSAAPSGPATGLGYNIVIGPYDSTLGVTLAATPATGTQYIVVAAHQSLVVVDPTLTAVHLGSSKPGNWGTASGVDNISIGHAAGAVIAAGARSIFLGRGAGVLATGVDDSVLIGNLVAAALLTADNEVVIGSGAAPLMTGASNTAVGRGAAAALTTGTFNTIIGARNTGGAAPTGPTSGSFHVVIGAFDSVSAANRNLAETPAGATNNYLVIAAGPSLVVVDPGLNNVHFGSVKPGNWRTATGTSNTALGGSSLIGLTSGDSNTGVGRFSLSRLTTGNDNIAIGRSSMASAAGSEAALRNVAVGNFTLDALTAAVVDSVAVGYNAGTAVTSGNNGIYIGSGAGAAVTTGGNNILLGFGVAPALTTGGSNIIIGVAATLPAVNTSSFLNIGATIFGDLANFDVRIGGTAATAVAQTERLAVTDTNADTVAPFSLETTGANGAKIFHFTGTRDPNGLVTGDPGDHYEQKSGTASTLWINVGAAPANTVWTSVITAPPLGPPLWFQCDAVDAIFESINFGGGAEANPTPTTRGTHAVLRYLVDVDAGTPWQRSVGNGYTGDNITVDIYWIGEAEGAGNVVWRAAFERDNTGADATTENWAAFQSVVSAHVGGDNTIQHAQITFTLAQADSIAAGEPLRFYLGREGTSVSDTYTVAAQLLRVVVSEV